MARILTKPQRMALKLRGEGKTPGEIAKKTNKCALDLGLNNLEGCVSIIEWATKQNALSKDQVFRLKKIL